MPEISPDIDFFENGLCFLCHVAKTELVEFQQFHDEVEEAWERLDRRVQRQLDKALKDAPLEHREDIFDSHTFDLYLSQTKFPSIHRESSVVMLYAFVEYELTDLAETVNESLVGELYLNDLKGAGIDRARRYLTKVAGLDFSSLEREWEYLTGMREFRNCIVHNGGILRATKTPNVRKLATRISGVEISSRNHIILRAECIPDLLELFVTLFDKLQKAVEDFIGRANISLGR
jgi:hypothetical protein